MPQFCSGSCHVWLLNSNSWAIIPSINLRDWLYKSPTSSLLNQHNYCWKPRLFVNIHAIKVFYAQKCIKTVSNGHISPNFQNFLKDVSKVGFIRLAFSRNNSKSRIYTSIARQGLNKFDYPQFSFIVTVILSYVSILRLYILLKFIFLTCQTPLATPHNQMLTYENMLRAVRGQCIELFLCTNWSLLILVYSLNASPILLECINRVKARVSVVWVSQVICVYIIQSVQLTVSVILAWEVNLHWYANSTVPGVIIGQGTFLWFRTRLFIIILCNFIPDLTFISRQWHFSGFHNQFPNILILVINTG